MAHRPDPDFERWMDDARAVPIKDLLTHPRMPKLKGNIRPYGPCPRCQDGDNRFSIHIVKNYFHCRWCGGGDVIGLCMILEGCDFVTACEYLTRRPPPGKVARETPEQREQRERDAQEWREKIQQENAQAIAAFNAYREKERVRCHKIWDSDAVPARGSIVERYLAYRNLDLPPGAHLRCVRRHPLFDRIGKGIRPVHVGPAMVAAILAPDGTFAGLHSTWIDLSQPNGKALVAEGKTGEFVPAKKVRGSQRGGRIELVRVAQPRRLFAGEGIETVLSVWRALRRVNSPLLEGAAFWSSINLGNLGGTAETRVAHPTLTRVDKLGRIFPLQVMSDEPDFNSEIMPVPDGVEELFLLGDADSDAFNTRNALLRASKRYAREGRTIRIPWADDGTDFNTMLRDHA